MFVDKYALWPHNKWNRYIHKHWLRKQRKKKIEFICKKAIPHTAHINKCKTKWPIAGPSSFFRCVCTKLINMLNSWWVLRIYNATKIKYLLLLCKYKEPLEYQKYQTASNCTLFNWFHFLYKKISLPYWMRRFRYYYYLLLPFVHMSIGMNNQAKRIVAPIWRLKMVFVYVCVEHKGILMLLSGISKPASSMEYSISAINCCCCSVCWVAILSLCCE